MFAYEVQPIAIVFRGDRGLELQLKAESLPARLIAIVFRGDRGLERRWGLLKFDRLTKLRSSFGAIEDWNSKI